MSILSLVDRLVIDAAADKMAERLEQDLINFGVESVADIDPRHVKDLGLVTIGQDGVEYYATVYTPPIQPEDEGGPAA